MTWHDYGSGSWCLQERECSKPVAMVWRHAKRFHGVIWDWPQAGERHRMPDYPMEYHAMGAIDRLREGGA